MRKEVRHILRDPYAFLGATVGTVLVMALLSYALSADIDHIPIAVVDGDGTPQSRAYLQRFDADVFFDIRVWTLSPEEARRRVVSGDVRGAIIVPPGFATSLCHDESVSVQVIVDGTDPTVARKIQSNAEQLSSNYAVQLQMERAAGSEQLALSPLEFRVHALYNPALKELNTILPGLMAFVLVFPCLFAMLSLVREKEQGSMEQLMTTPVRRYQLLIGKLVPYLLIGLLDVLMLTAIGCFFFDIPFRGTLADLLLLSGFFLLANLGISMLLSSVLRNQMAALIVGSMLFVFPITQSGLATPVFALPQDAQIRALIWPATHYIIITRAIFLKGLGLSDLIAHGSFLLVTGLVLNGLALWRLKMKFD
jgi:ABC-2 type transport system permease protein